MIVPMKKVVLLALESNAREALEELRSAGVMQIDRAEQGSADTASLIEKRAHALRILAELEKTGASPVAHPALSGAEVLEHAAKALEKRNAAESDAEKLQRRLSRLAPWGDFDGASLKKLRADGVTVTLVEGDEKKLAAAKALEGFCCREISREGAKVNFVLLGTSEPDPELFPGVVLADDDDPKFLRTELEKCRTVQKEAREELARCGACIALVKEEVSGLTSAVEFHQAADALTDAGPVVYLTGFVPEPELDVLRQAAKKNGWGLVIRDPGADEIVPVLVKESRFSRIIKPLFDFLGVLPGYREMDVSGGVLVFFTIFYAMIIGDAGYGLLFLILALVCKAVFRKKAALRTPLNLLILLSCATIVWGGLSGNWFGIKGIPGIKWLTDEKVKDTNVQFFCFLLAFAQLGVGRVWRAIHEGGLRSYVRHLGWALIILGNMILTLKIIVWPGNFPVAMYWIYGIGLAMVMVADVNWRDPADCFQFPFSVIGSFTDVLSYIRLFAVGMAGSCIAESFNNMGVDVVKASVWAIPVGILAILCGHALNIALGFMSVLVHGVRLNTLEFSNHTGLSWSGQPFKPFKKHDTEE